MSSNSVGKKYEHKNIFKFYIGLFMKIEDREAAGGFGRLVFR
jgi:hypothetical protein